jgi:hypothetical protein
MIVLKNRQIMIYFIINKVIFERTSNQNKWTTLMTLGKISTRAKSNSEKHRAFGAPFLITIAVDKDS